SVICKARIRTARRSWMCALVAVRKTLSLVAPATPLLYCRDPACGAGIACLSSGGVMGPTRRTGVIRGAAFAAVLALAAGILSSSTAGAGSGNGDFIIRCPMTGEVQPIDPILAPRGTAAHQHMFFGNDSVNAASTAAGLRSHGTTCQDSKDTAAYWAPE